MIASLLFHGLYPISRYLLGRYTETQQIPSMSNLCDSGKEKRVSFTGRNLGLTLSYKEIQTRPLSTADETPSAGTSEERLMDHWDPPVQHKHATTHLHQQVFDMNLNEMKLSEGSGSVQHQDALLADNLALVQTVDRTIPVESCKPAGIEEPEVPAPLPWRERWDEYTEHIIMGKQAGVLDLRSLLSDSQAHQEETEAEGSCGPQTGWHFSTGPGLADVVHCPLLQFPSMSYYPPFQHELEVVWRVWEEVNESRTTAVGPSKTPSSCDTDPKCASFPFTVMSYNILAQDLLEAHQQLYSHCPLEALVWSNRCQLLQQEILRWMPDILCLQEVQEDHYKEQLHSFLSQIGYKCVYKRRTGTKTDGCATCYRGDRFSEMSTSLLEFFRPETVLLDRDNVGICLLLRPTLPPGSSEVAAQAPPICVANTHLLFNPRRGDVKLAQLAIVLAEVDAVVEACKSRGQQCNVILCGDLNAVPHVPLYQLITWGQLYYHGLPAWTVSGVEDLSYRAHHDRLYAPLWPSSLGVTHRCQYTSSQEKCERHDHKEGKHQYSHDFLLQLRLCPAASVRPADLVFIPHVTDNTPDISGKVFPQAPSMGPVLSHGLGLRSVYQHILPGLGHPEVTTLHSEAGATVDYIFYTPKCDPPSDDQKGFGSHLSGSLELTGYLSLLSEGDLWSMKGLPNQHFPSDHLSLLAKFQLDLSPAL